MSDAIDLLEAVGRDASLRRLPPNELARKLTEAGASDVLAQAAALRDRDILAQELTILVQQQPQYSQEPFREEEEDEEGEPAREDGKVGPAGSKLH
ncbi:hypothetical protein KPL74_14545 [Bacillus sp. NP157]|nr:hypothetical protein KPL74_14545 [Bacillus sp. NP157]